MLAVSDSVQGRVYGAGVRLDPRDPYLRVQSVTVFVRNLEHSLEFYLDQLQFQLVFDARVRPGKRWVAVAPPDGTANLTLVEPEPQSEQAKLIGQNTHITFVTEDVIAKFREWSKRGVKFQFTPRLRRLKYGVDSRMAGPQASTSASPTRPPIWGGVFTRFKDPDGNAFSLVSFDEVTEALEAQRRAIAEKEEAERRLAQELEIAKQVQARLFPQTLPLLRTLEYAGICLQARKVGGDYYDFLDMGGDRLALVVGDISGKGIAAALLMANLQANLRSQRAVAADQLDRLLCGVNELFCDNTPDGSYATLFLAEYDDSSGRLRYANCGHLCAILLRGDGTIERLGSTGTVLGLFKQWSCGIEERCLHSGDTLAFYTDGITESCNSEGEEFGEERLIETLRRHRELSADALLDAVVSEVRRFSPLEQQDDITLIVGQCRRA
jgi:serine phosphatase RsbU (regulator of sigma subunit)/catechol 2,3-dioxygenase-like lactoylglutathione lyase family enzyme